MQLVISGSRYLNDYELLNKTLLRVTFRWDWKKLKLHLGDNKGDKVKQTAGADALAARWCSQWYIPYCRYRADWTLGKKAGPLRNREMLDGAGPGARVLCFHDGRTDGCGTWDMIQEAKRRGLDLKIIKVKIDG